MKTILWKPFAILALCGLFACSQGAKKYHADDMDSKSAENAAVADSDASAKSTASDKAEANNALGVAKTKSDAMTSSSAAVEKNQDNKKFVRSANLRFRVKNVVKATYAIEDIVGRQGGYVGYTSLKSDVDNKTVTPVSEDSSVETEYVNVSNSMTIRVPNTQLDTTLKSIGKLVEFLDSRTIKADDVTLQLLANRWEFRRKANEAARLSHAVDSHGKKLADITGAESNLANVQEDAGNALMGNLSMNDQVKYSTVTMDLYQRQALTHALVANDKDIRAFEPSLGRKIATALQSGWHVFEDVLVFLMGIWWLILIGLAVVLVYRSRRVAKSEAAV